jgi:tetratricopeptide (TPR) repeat protein
LGYGGYGYGLGYGGYGYGMGYGGYGYGYPGYYYGGYANAVLPATTAQAPAAVPASDAQVFAEKGENDFKRGDYKAAVYAWRHALLDDPQNGVLLMMLAQGLFATGKFDEAAGATQQAMALLSDDQWGVVVSNYRELYGRAGDYTTQLRALEKTIRENPDDPGTRFLLGFHYGYLGYASHAVKQLDKTLKLEPKDDLAQQLRDIMAGKGQPPAKAAPGGQPNADQNDANGKEAGVGGKQKPAV